MARAGFGPPRGLCWMSLKPHSPEVEGRLHSMRLLQFRVGVCASPLAFGSAVHKMTINWPGLREGASTLRLAGNAAESMCALVVLGCSVAVCLCLREKQRPTRHMAHFGFFVWGIANAAAALGEHEVPPYIAAAQLVSMTALCVFLQATCVGHVSVLLVALVAIPDACVLGATGMPLLLGAEGVRGSVELACNMAAMSVAMPAMHVTTSFAQGWKGDARSSSQNQARACQDQHVGRGAVVGPPSADRPLRISYLSGKLVLELAADDIAGLTLAAVKARVGHTLGVQPHLLVLVSQHGDVAIGGGEEGAAGSQCLWPLDVSDACLIILPERCEGITTPTSLSNFTDSEGTDGESSSSSAAAV